MAQVRQAVSDGQSHRKFMAVISVVIKRRGITSGQNDCWSSFVCARQGALCGTLWISLQENTSLRSKILQEYKEIIKKTSVLEPYIRGYRVCRY